MNKQDQEILRVNHVFLVDNLNLKDDETLKGYLVQEKLLTTNDLERLQASTDFLEGEHVYLVIASCVITVSVFSGYYDFGYLQCDW